MKSFSFAKALSVVALVCFALPVACGDDDDDTTPNTPVGGAGGEPAANNGGDAPEAGAGGMATMLPAGLSDVSKTEMCGGDSCTSAAVGGGAVFIDPCCAADGCGLATGFLELVGAHFAQACQPKGQPGAVDEACPSSAASAVPFGGAMLPIAGFAGCCRENGMCGVVVDDVTSPVAGKLASLGLGCVDAAPFFPGEKVASCGAGGAGMGGAGGMGGMGGAAGGEAGTQSIGGSGGGDVNQ
jgi:hypothetical protein